jgi:hypothetical protein
MANVQTQISENKLQVEKCNAVAEAADERAEQSLRQRADAQTAFLQLLARGAVEVLRNSSDASSERKNSGARESSPT